MTARTKLRAAATFVAGDVLLSACGPATPPAPSASDKIKRGAYLDSVAACGDCHTPSVMLGKAEIAPAEAPVAPAAPAQ